MSIAWSEHDKVVGQAVDNGVYVVGTLDTKPRIPENPIHKDHFWELGRWAMNSWLVVWNIHYFPIYWE